MIRNLKLLGLALMVAAALATASATASANFDSTAEVTKLSGGQSTTHELTVAAGSMTCEEASFPGESIGVHVGGGVFTSSTVTIKPAYNKCSAVVLGEKRTAHVNMNGCHYLFHSGAATESGTRVHGSVDVVCPAGASIDIQITGAEICTITIPTQKNIGGIVYHNTGAGSTRDVDVTANVSTLEYTQHGFLCPYNNFSLTKAFANGKYTGSTTEIGKNSVGDQVGIWVT